LLLVHKSPSGRLPPPWAPVVWFLHHA
jgi:hypothetical protein